MLHLSCDTYDPSACIYACFAPLVTRQYGRSLVFPSLAAPAPSHNLRVWYASYMPSCTRLPKTGVTNQNAPRLISEYLCLLRQKNDLNYITIVKKLVSQWTKSETKTCVVLGRAFHLGRYMRNSNYSLIFELV